jgi:hypothetical protein
LLVFDLTPIFQEKPEGDECRDYDAFNGHNVEQVNRYRESEKLEPFKM